MYLRKLKEKKATSTSTTLKKVMPISSVLKCLLFQEEYSINTKIASPALSRS